MRMESSSTWYATLTENAPVAIHVKRVITCERSAAGDLSISKNIQAVITNETPMAPEPIIPLSFSEPSFLPKRPFSRNPRKGVTTMYGTREGIDNSDFAPPPESEEHRQSCLRAPHFSMQSCP